MNYTKIKGIDNETIYIKIYNVENPKGCIQVVHGMMEHQDRYVEFAKRMNKLGYSVVTSDLRGHGKNASTLGYFAKKNGHLLLISDQVTITNYIQNVLHINNIILFAHSMGSIIARNVLINNSSSYSKVILSGFPPYQWAASLGLGLAGFISFFKTNNGKSKILDNATLGPYIKAVKNRKSDADWVSYSKTNIDNYNNDPLCGVYFTCSAYKDLCRLVKGLHIKKSTNVVNMPILLLSGKDDPVIGGTKGYKQTVSDLNRQGFDNLKHVEFDHMRHEILNEDNKDLVYEEIEKFLGE